MLRKKSARSVRSDVSEMDVEEAESQIARLQRQLRIMERDQRAYSFQAREQIRKQEQEIGKLLKEHEELHENLGACKSAFRQQQDIEDTQTLRAMLQQKDRLEEEMVKEKQCQKEIEKEIANMEAKIAELRKGDVSVTDAQRSSVQQTQKAIRNLEHKQDRASIRFNQQLNKNSRLKDELKNLIMERNRFEQLRQRLEMELNDTRKKVREVVSLSTSAYESSVEAQSKMTMMKEKAEKDLAQYNTEMKELEKVIAHEFSLKDFMNTKCSERSGQDDGQETGQGQLQRDQKMVDSGEESPDTLEEMFGKIHALTGEENLDLLGTRFIQVEDRNFALLNFVNEQNNEAEVLREQISQIETEIEQIAEAGVQQERDHHFLLQAIEEKRMDLECKTEEYQNRASFISKVLDTIKTGVNSIFSKLECDRSVIEDKVGCSSGISDNNIMSYLGLVEQKTNELLTIQAFLNSKDLEKDYNPRDLTKFLLGQNPEQLQQDVNHQPTIDSLEYEAEESPVTDEDERPLSQWELRRKILTGVLQRDGGGLQADS